MTTKSYESVTELLKGIGADSSFVKSVEKEIQDRSIAKVLVQLRHKASLTQSDIAEKLGVKQSTVSKIERSANADLRMGEIGEYLRAVGCKMNFAVHGNDATLADQVKFHVFQINDLLHQLATLTTKDATLGPAINHFFFEALHNFVKGIESASSKIQSIDCNQSQIEFVDIASVTDDACGLEGLNGKLATC